MSEGLAASLRDGLRSWLGAALLAGLATTLSTPARAARAADPASHGSAQARVEAIARRLLIAGADRCPDQRSDFGLVTAPASANSWGAPITRVWPDGPAAALGLRAGDLVQAVNGIPWSADAAERRRFGETLAAASNAPHAVLVIERDGQRRTLMLAGQPRCHAEIRVSAQPFVNATAVDSTIVVGGGLVRLLRDDAELAFAVAHEAAHIVLGHTAPDRRSAVGTFTERLGLEREADALAVRLMGAAGYTPAAAPAAWTKIADASRPPLARMMDLHGPYMSTPERTAFLAAEAARLTPRHALTTRLSR